MSIYHKLLRLYARSAVELSSNKHLFLGESQPFLPDKVSQDLCQFQSSNAPNADMSTESSSQRKFNPLTDSHPGLHEYE